MDAERKRFGSAVAMLDEYTTRQGKVLTAQDAWQKKIIDGKATFGDLIRNHKMFNTVLKDQLALRKAAGIAWANSPATGKSSVDLFIPKGLDSSIATTSQKIGLMSNMLNSASDNLIKWGKNTQWAGRQLMVGFTVPMGIAIGGMGKLAYDLDKQLTQVVKVYGDATQQMQDSAESVRSTALSTAESAARIYGQSAETTLGIMADLAASGKSGIELQQATMSTTRAAILGELDWQDAVKATISMQEVYGSGLETVADKQQMLADNWNYINAMENQTVLSAQDFVTAIPRVSGVMKALGADLKDTGTLLTAFKASGIDAAEGANALKSINFRLVATYGKGLETYRKATGGDLKALVDSTNAEAIPTLEAFAKSLEGLSKQEKVMVTRDVFGIYQGSKALMLMQQMIEKSDQWQAATKVAGNSAIENAAIAQQELDRQYSQPYKRLDRAVESLKITLQKIGEGFLGPAATVLEFISKIANAFNSLSPAAKTFIGVVAGAVAIAGPLVMLAGLMGNLVGNVGKGISKLAMMKTSFKMLTAEQQMEAIASSRLTSQFDTQTSAAANLTLTIQKLTAALKEESAAQSMAAAEATKTAAAAAAADARMNATPSGMRVNAAGKHVWDKGNQAGMKSGSYVSATDLAAIREFDANVAAQNAARTSAAKEDAQMRMGMYAKMNEAEGKITEAVAAQQTKVDKLAHSFTTASVSVGVLGTMLGVNDGIAGNLIMIANGIGVLGMVAPKTFSKIIGYASAAGQQIKGKLGFAVGGAESKFAGLAKYAKAAGPIIGAIAIAGYTAWNKFNEEIERSVQKLASVQGYAKSMADVLGYSWTEGMVKQDGSAMDGMQATKTLVEKLKETNKDAWDQFRAMDTEAAKSGDGLSEKWTTALNAGIRAKMHGAGKDSVENTIRVALSAMGENYTDSEFKLRLAAELDFNDADAVFDMQMKEWNAKLNKAMTINPNGANAWEGIFNGGQLSQAGAEYGRQVGEDFWSTFSQTAPAGQKEMLKSVATQQDKYLNDFYNSQKQRLATQFKNLGINNARDLSKALSEGTVSATSLGITEEQFAALRKRAGFVQEMARQVAILGGVSEESAGKIYTMFDLFQHGQITSGFDEVKIITGQISTAVDTLNTKMTTLKATSSASTNAMAYFGSIINGAKVDVEEFNKQLETLGFNSAITYQTMEDSWKSVYSGAQEGMFAEADRIFSEQQNADMERWQSAAQARIDAIEARGERVQARFDKKQDALDAKHDKMKDSFDKKWDVKKDKATAVYDARTEAVQRVIDAEQKAEEIRQRIFEAEKTRLQRLSEMYNTRVDINAAISTGKLDEAAKLQSTAMAQQSQWSIDDMLAKSGDASKTRIQKLEDKKSAIGKEKDARLKALDQIKNAEKAAMDQRIANEKRSLKAQQDAAKRSIDNEKKTQQARNTTFLNARKREQEATRRAMESDLATLRAFLPKNEAQFNSQRVNLEQIYNKYGVALTAKGTGWATTVAKTLTSKTKEEGAKLSSVVNWSSVGTEIARAMMVGAFGMTPQQFAKWINGGTAPSTSIFAKSSGVPRSVSGKNKELDAKARHTGGLISRGGMGGGRVGHSGEQSQSEVWVNALYGEGVVNKKGMSVLGPGGLNAINSGNVKQLDAIGGAIPRGIGGGGMKGLGTLPGAMQAGMGKALIQAGIRGIADNRIGASGSGIPTKVETKTTLAGEIGNIASAVTGIISGGSAVSGVAKSSYGWRSGPVISPAGVVTYLGHGSYPGGANFAGSVRPIPGRVASEFGPRNLLGMTYHNGIDIMNNEGTPIRAALGGKILFTGWNNTGYGNYTLMRGNDGTMMGYGHQSAIAVGPGDIVKTGETIGRVGNTGKSTGPHLHFQTGRNGKWFNPRAIMPQLNDGGFTLNEGLANLHPKETVLTAPLTERFKQGVDNFANSSKNQYNVNISVEGPINSQIDWEAGVEKALKSIEKKKGPRRKVGE